MKTMSSDFTKTDKLRFVPAFLLLISFVTHVSQLFIFKINISLIIVAVFGLLYFIIGFLYIIGYKYSPHLSSVIPAIGASLGVYRFLTILPNIFSILNVSLDAIIVPFSIIIIIRWNKYKKLKDKL
ncbi:hypothetical protein [Caldisphaera sp.]|uniref:hypothetical protein n=2 Tax=Caldisphaera sp. TaxID=2060322 RepID=UPI003D0F805A